MVLLVLTITAGTLLREIWGSPLWTFVGVWLLVRFGRPEAEMNWRWAAWRWAVVAALLVAFTVGKQLAGPHLTGKAERPHFPGRQLAAEVNRLWAERYGGLPPIIGGEAWRAGNVACYSPHRPVVYTTGVMGHLVMDPEYSPWTSDAEVNARGGVIVWDADVISAERLAAIAARFPRFEVLPVIELPQQTGANVPPTRVGVGFVPPAANP
jgi:hypothetical protein